MISKQEGWVEVLLSDFRCQFSKILMQEMQRFSEDAFLEKYQIIHFHVTSVWSTLMVIKIFALPLILGFAHNIAGRILTIN